MSQNVTWDRGGQQSGNIINYWINLQSTFQKIADLLSQVEKQDPKRIPVVRERIEKAVAEWSSSDTFDKNRFEQELIYYLEKQLISYSELYQYLQ